MRGQAVPEGGEHGWRSPVEEGRHDRSPHLTGMEQQALVGLLASRSRWGDGGVEAVAERQQALARLLIPLQEALDQVEGRIDLKEAAAVGLLRACGREGLAFWGWNGDTWCRILGPTQAAFFRETGHLADGDHRQYMMAAAYILGCFRNVRALGDFKRVPLATKVFGRELVQSAIQAVGSVISGWGYYRSSRVPLESTVCELFLLIGSPRLEDITLSRLAELGRGVTPTRRSHFLKLRRALVALGFLKEPLPAETNHWPRANEIRVEEGIHPDWMAWVHRWESTSTLAPTTRRSARIVLMKAGRWLAANHPEVTTPEQWTRELAVSYVAAIDRMKAGEYTGPHVKMKNRSSTGHPLSARTKDDYLSAMRVFFWDCHEWGWIPHRFDPGRALATPRSVKALIGPSPRVIADDVWARLLWSGLNLGVEDLRRSDNHPTYYPVEFVRAVAIVWLFSGLRSDEIVRLRVGCVRWQQEDTLVPSTGEMLPKKAVCLLEIPVNKTGTAFTKPVDPVVGEAIRQWERVRPQQPVFADRKTGELVHFLFCQRARPLTPEYLNGSLIPILCRKAGVAKQDVRGSITSHRARSTIASQLFNAREPMSLFELQAWLGHRSPASTRNYVALTPTKLAKAYVDAGYFARNVRAIEVLIDQEAVKSAAAAAGEPWRYYDLGHGLCSYEFFDQCPHRMACARCDFYNAKGSSRGQLLEAKSNLLRLLQEIPLTEEERSAVDGDLSALDRLVARLVDQATPSGQTPGQLAAGPAPTSAPACQMADPGVSGSAGGRACAAHP